METCTFCKEPILEDNESCVKCGFPFRATEEVKSSFVAEQLLKRSKIHESDDAIHRARKILWFLSVLLLIQTLAVLLNPRMPLFVGIMMSVLTLLFVSSSFLVKKKPKLALSAPFSLLSLSFLMDVIMSERLSVFDILFPLGILAVLGFALYSVVKADRIRAETAYLSKS